MLRLLVSIFGIVWLHTSCIVIDSLPDIRTFALLPVEERRDLLPFAVLLGTGVQGASGSTLSTPRCNATSRWSCGHLMSFSAEYHDLVEHS